MRNSLHYHIVNEICFYNLSTDEKLLSLKQGKIADGVRSTTARSTARIISIFELARIMRARSN